MLGCRQLSALPYLHQGTHISMPVVRLCGMHLKRKAIHLVVPFQERLYSGADDMLRHAAAVQVEAHCQVTSLQHQVHECASGRYIAPRKGLIYSYVPKAVGMVSSELQVSMLEPS